MVGSSRPSEKGHRTDVERRVAAVAGRARTWFEKETKNVQT